MCMGGLTRNAVTSKVMVVRGNRPRREGEDPMISSHRPIKPQTSASVADVVSYLGSFEMFKEAPVPKPAVHETEVVWTPSNHGYPYLAKCSCGWTSRRYAAEHAAKYMADDHVSA
ncbi:gp39 [Mycobacterium phage Fruitloop]|uniref:Uncharacterized protein n=3 Tax=Cheoctovirus TaxID=1623281 RepID=B5U4N8_9CAUD|nr:gp39 [Mycobacterium phage Fruitloop]YP_009959612.1 hypothetical protein I5H62_gp41 [Mycobacterium phage Melissauren88]ACI12353.1 hypothetical protein FRUITLOOP_39 [Mycobacterium phage Fruitloop]AWH14145.1 hypothetical protein SEA_MELISSAUREN88_41 [Mycobacterium phage Melissauren88]